MTEVNPDACWNVGLDSARRVVWCQMKQTHCSSIREMGILTCPLYWSGYEQAGGQILLPAKEGRDDDALADASSSTASRAPPQDYEEGWSVCLDASRSFFVSIDIDELISSIYKRLSAVDMPEVLAERWSQLGCFKDLQTFRDSVTEICLTSSSLEYLPHSLTSFKHVRVLYMNHAHLPELRFDQNQPALQQGPSISSIFPSLRLLDLRHNKLTQATGAAFTSLLANLDHLETLLLSCNFIEDINLPHLPALKELGLYSNRLGEKALLKKAYLINLLSHLAKAAPNLAKVYLQGNPCFEQVNFKEIEEIVESQQIKFRLI